MDETMNKFADVMTSSLLIDRLTKELNTVIHKEQGKMIEAAKDIIFVVEKIDCRLIDVDAASGIMTLRAVRESEYFRYGGKLYKTNLYKLYESKYENGKYYVPDIIYSREED